MMTVSRKEETYVSSPGDTIQDLLVERGWDQKELANRLGLSNKTVEQLITAKVPLTPTIASKLATVLGSTLQFWLNREANYRITTPQN
jgi:HTH-type transcriptional regulator/antitoxin HigA